MNKNNTIMLIDCLSLTLVLSFFLIHNINIVLIGLLLSLYSLNKNSIHIYIKKTSNEKLEKEDLSIVNNVKQFPVEKKIIEEDSIDSLVESIEELGYIPSKNKKTEDRAA